MFTPIKSKQEKSIQSFLGIPSSRNISEKPISEDNSPSSQKTDSQTPPPTDFGFSQWKKDNKVESFQAIAKNLQPVIDKAVQVYAGPRSSPNIRNKARILAMRAVRGYDPERGTALTTHVMRQLQALQRIAPSINDPLPAPEKFRRDAHLISQHLEAGKNEFGRELTDEELADATGLPPKRVIRVRSRMRAKIPMTVAEEASEDDDSTNDVIGSERTDYDDWTDAVYHDLGDIDKLILQYRTGYRGAEQLSNTDIAKRVGMSPAAVTQRASKIQAKLDQFHA